MRDDGQPCMLRSAERGRLLVRSDSAAFRHPAHRLIDRLFRSH